MRPRTRPTPHALTIDYLAVVPLLAAACPTYQEPLVAAVEQNGEFIAVGHVVEHLIRLLAEGDTQHFPEVFAVIERVLAEGDDAARDLVNRGFLDDLANPDFYCGTGTEPTDFVPWLGPLAGRERPIRSLFEQ